MHGQLSSVLSNFLVNSKIIKASVLTVCISEICEVNYPSNSQWPIYRL